MNEKKKCTKCNSNLKFSDNSITKIKNESGFVEIYPVCYCSTCDIYYSNELDGKGFTNKLNKEFIKELGCDKWFNE